MKVAPERRPALNLQLRRVLPKLVHVQVIGIHWWYALV